jgi:hypothetical protein
MSPRKTHKSPITDPEEMDICELSEKIFGHTHSMWDLSSPARDGTCASCSGKQRILTTRARDTLKSNTLKRSLVNCRNTQTTKENWEKHA